MSRQSFRMPWTNAVASMALAIVATMAGAAGATAQNTPDVRWQAGIGCWAPTNGPSGSMVCIIPAQGTSAVDIASVSGGKIISREHVQADGERRAASKDDCSGW